MAECSIFNIGSCLPQKFFEFVFDIINAPLGGFANTALDLLSEPVNLSIFFSVWAIIVYMLSMFYALLLISSGFTFIISGDNPEKREGAKMWLRNIVIMMILIQSSYFLYQLVIDLNSIMTSAVLSMLDPSFLLASGDSFSDIGSAVFFGLIYMIVLILTMIILVIRYDIMAIGVVLLPIAIFMYFIPFLRSYGALILNFLGTVIFASFFSAILLIGFSQLSTLPLFQNMNLLVPIASFLVIDVMIILLMLFSIVKAVFGVYTDIKSVKGKL